MDALNQIPLFEGIGEAELAWVRANSREVIFARGEYAFREGERAEVFYIVLEGELQITRQMFGHERVIGTTPRGIIGGELPLLDGTLVATVNSRAIIDTRVLLFELGSFRRIFAEAPTLGARILSIAANRMAGIANMGRQQEKTAALGKLASGLAHELNNPAAAARRAASSLGAALYDLQFQTVRLAEMGLTSQRVSELLALQQDLIRTSSSETPLTALEYSDRETEMAEWLEFRGLEAAWDMAAVFVNAGVTPQAMEMLLDGLQLSDPVPMLTWLCSAFGAASLIQDLERGTRRISDLVEKVKGYTYMDEAPVQDVDVHAALENTLSILRPQVGERTVIKVFDPELPRVTARGSELNQIWTNLVENAIEATDSTGTITVITRFENAFAMIEINDDGVGISEDIEGRIWEPFFTTKDPARHTGLGLDIVYRIVRGHNGSIEARPEAGRTRFIVRLPIEGMSE